MAESPDGRYVPVANNGYARPMIFIIDVQHRTVHSTLRIDDAWLGLAWHPDGRHVFVSGAGNDTVHELTWSDGAAA
jgi:hypothetical protein